MSPYIRTTSADKVSVEVSECAWPRQGQATEFGSRYRSFRGTSEISGQVGSHGRDGKFRHHGTYHFCSWANVPSFPRPRPLAVFMIFSIMGVLEEEVMATHISCHGVAQEPWSRRRSMRINVAQPHPELGVQVLRVWWLSRPPAEAAKNRQSQSRGRLCRDAQSFSAAPRNGCGQSPCHHARVQCPTGRTPASTSSRCSTLTR